MRILLIITICFSSILSNAQNWNIILENDTLIYTRDEGNFVEIDPVWVDSIDVQGTQTTYFLNIKMMGDFTNGPSNVCDSSLFRNGSYIQQQPDSDFIWVCERIDYGPLGFVIHKSGNKYSIVLEDIKLLLKSDASVGDVWLADSVHHDSMRCISASISNIGIGQITDSVKVFRFNGRDFHLSKNYGLVQFPLLSALEDFSLAGVQNQNIGAVIPKKNDFFNVDVGDKFTYDYNKVSDGSLTEYKWDRTIQGKWWVQDTVFLAIHNKRLNKISVPSTPFTAWDDTIKYHPSLYPMLENMANSNQRCHNHQGLFIPMTLVKTADGLVDAQRRRVAACADSVITLFNSQNNELTLKAGSLESYKSTMSGNDGVWYWLKGYEKADGTSWYYGGYPSYWLGKEDEKVDFELEMYPNPAKNVLVIKGSQLEIMRMYDTQGRLIQTQNLSQSTQVNLSNIAEGIYFIHIQNQTKQKVVKRLVVR